MVIFGLVAPILAGISGIGDGGGIATSSFDARVPSQPSNRPGATPNAKSDRTMVRGLVVSRVAKAFTLFAMMAWLVACGVEQPATDPRAYPGSTITNLDRALELYNVKLPQCAEAAVRYGRYASGPFGTLYLRFDGERECIDEFLSANSSMPPRSVSVVDFHSFQRSANSLADHRTTRRSIPFLAANYPRPERTWLKL